MDKDILEIHCTTVTICKNTWTGKVYKDEEEMKADVANPDTAYKNRTYPTGYNCASIPKRYECVTKII